MLEKYPDLNMPIGSLLYPKFTHSVTMVVMQLSCGEICIFSIPSSDIGRQKT